MDLHDIRRLYAYNRWANRRMFAVVVKLSEEQVAAPIPSSFPSIRESVYHILFAEWVWLRRWKGMSPRAKAPNPDGSLKMWTALRGLSDPSPEELSTVAGLRRFSESLENERQEYLRGLTEEVLQAPLNFHDMAGTPYSEPLVQLMQHVANHGSYHRGQVTTLLRQIGAETVPLDMIYFFREEVAGAASAR